MSHQLVTPGRDIKERAAAAVANPELQQALHNLDTRLHTARAVAEHHADLKHRGAAIRRETLADLGHWLDRLQETLEGLGAHVHRCATPEEARRVVLDVARREDVRQVVKAKSMATEEIDLADALEAAGIETVETDLGEYVVQVAGERPSHIITPVIHKTLRQIADVLSAEAGTPLPVDREALTEWVRHHLRARFLDADMGITGANFVAADTGTIVVVTNEGNGRFCTSLPRVHVCVMPVEKVVPRFADLGVLLPLLTMSATGQRLSNYLSMVTGPRRPGETDGPEQLHVVFLDHERTTLLGTPYEDMLACIRCGACLNVCPVYRKVGGHAYDAVYTGPMGKVLTPFVERGRGRARPPRRVVAVRRVHRGLPGRDPARRPAGAAARRSPQPGPAGRGRMADTATPLPAPAVRRVGAPVGSSLGVPGEHDAGPDRRADHRRATGMDQAGPQALGLDGIARPAGTDRRAVPGTVAGTGPRAMVIAAFAAAAAANTCAVHGPVGAAAVADAVVDIVRGHAAGDVAVPEGDALLDGLGIPTTLAAAGVGLIRPSDAAWTLRLADASIGITSASAAVAATGTVAVVSGPGAPRATSLLPPVHICVVRAGDIAAEFADVIERMANEALPSALIWVGGPSRTADLEMHQTLGVHGPKVVELVLVDSVV